MQTMWAPWRIEYILGEKEEGCVFCNAMGPDDALTLFKGPQTMVVMNKFPYINGHLLVAPTRHVAALDQLSGSEMAVLLKTVEQSIAVLKRVMRPVVWRRQRPGGLCRCQGDPGAPSGHL